eukprot:CAMPEP_0170595526 /NCGR_PEP_ID=MMETSP0224-20130122/14613_1 /TAXON_ID=285029 /ORGANISM="Togula jolla, Strain CCCM 725" /LENGTH=197 /DNA_ID=CAMNT_0010919721 /DNA_START=80 /DNA_END=673 /DNA_ORIENTATION=+
MRGNTSKEQAQKNLSVGPGRPSLSLRLGQRRLLAAHEEQSPLAEEKVRQEVSHVLIKLILRGQEHGLVVDQQEQQVEEEEQDNANDHHGVGRDAILLCSNSILAVERLQEIAQTSPDAEALGKRGTCLELAILVLESVRGTSCQACRLRPRVARSSDEAEHRWAQQQANSQKGQKGHAGASTAHRHGCLRSALRHNG